MILLPAFLGRTHLENTWHTVKQAQHTQEALNKKEAFFFLFIMTPLGSELVSGEGIFS